ncbi:phospholipid phosphatase 5-like [Gigantopelta aegis]|uniref:phospholipid phosphatase 5-like n=1 Tax=Gigantopelta aegis TaxID=1735272 RepID=UPI001B88D975|nr:phospholipid phosphatase 5-like [Gigantopelta aegis]XP_041368046.1 phospholipid phosphatase 5-like [Gigantopelta aegis]
MFAFTEKNMHLLQEFGIRIILFIVYRSTDDMDGFHRKIQPEEMWLYRFPKTNAYYSVDMLHLTIYGVPLLVLTLFYLRYRDRHDCMEASLGVSLSIFLTASLTNVFKLFVGRPRPDFLARCYPDGKIHEGINCTGNIDTVIEGYKSFPSGHSSFSFSSLGYMGLYVAGKLHVFSASGRGRTWRLCSVLTLFVWPILIALSRTADYHHHWQDVLVGSLLGMTVAFVCYHQSYPSVYSIHSHLTYSQLATTSHRDIEAHLQEWHIGKDGNVKHMREIV